MTLPAPYYVDESVVLLHGDCLDLLPLLAERGLPWFGQERVDHVLTDPPYSERVEAGARSLSKKRGGKGPANGRNDHREGELGGALVPFATSSGAVRNTLILCAARRWSLVFCDLVHAAQLELSPPDGLAHVRTGAWIKPDGAPQFTGDRPAQGWEALCILHGLGERKRWNGGGARAVWSWPVERSVPDHPTPKPLGLIRHLIEQFTDPGDLILDPFAGSGTTGLAARLEGRRAILIEREERYAEVAARRLERMPRGTSVQPSLFAEVAS